MSMETKFFEKWISLTCVFVLLILGQTTMAYAENVEVNQLLQDARQKMDMGDLSGAAQSYKKVLNLEKDHKEARYELANTLIKSQIQEPYSEQTDAIEAMLEETNRVEE